MKTLTDYLDEGQRRFDEALDQAERKDKALKAQQAQRFAHIMELALAHLPGFLHPYACGEMSGQTLDDARRGLPDFVVQVDAPELGTMRFNFSLHPFRHAGEITAVTEWQSYEKGIEIISWDVRDFDEGYYLYPNVVFRFEFSQLPEALLAANSYKDNKAQAQAVCDEKNAAYRADIKAQAIAKPHEFIFCPLIQDECRGQKCAWFISFQETRCCALKIVAEANTEKLGSLLFPTKKEN